jgi:hypothetical protein
VFDRPGQPPGQRSVAPTPGLLAPGQHSVAPTPGLLAPGLLAPGQHSVAPSPGLLAPDLLAPDLLAPDLPPAEATAAGSVSGWWLLGAPSRPVSAAPEPAASATAAPPAEAPAEVSDGVSELASAAVSPRPASRPVPAFTAHRSVVVTQRPRTVLGHQPSARAPLGRVVLGRPARRGHARVALAATLLVALVLGGTLAAVALTPRYLVHRDEATWASTRLVLPADAMGLPRASAASESAQAGSARSGMLAAGTGQLITDVGVYGTKAGRRIIVVAGRPQHPLSEAERTLVRDGFSASLARSGVVLASRDPGPLGGWLGCGVRDGRSTVCLAVDAGAVISITLPTTGPTAIATAGALRSTIELRTS